MRTKSAWLRELASQRPSEPSRRSDRDLRPSFQTLSVRARFADSGLAPVPYGLALTEGLVQGLVRRAAGAAGLQNNGPHMLRHTFCSHLAMRAAPARAIQELAGHAD